MTRIGTLPSGVAAAVSEYGYRAKHAVVIGTPTPLRWCDGPTALVIGSDTYYPGAITPSSVALVGLPSITIRVPNTANEVSQPDAVGTVIKASLKVYEVHWSAAGAQLSEVPLFDGEVVSTACGQDAANIAAKARVAGTAGMVGRPLGRLCFYNWKDGRCGSLGAYPAAFTRATTAYKQDGASVGNGAPRYEAAKYSNNGVTVEEGVTNLLTANQASVETDLTGFANFGGTLTRDTVEHWNGVASAKLVCTAIDQYIWDGGAASRPAATAGTTYTFSLWIKGEAGKKIKVNISFWDAGGGFLGAGADLDITLVAGWQRLANTAAAPANTATAGFFIVNRTAGAHTFYADGLMIAAKPYIVSWQLPATRNAETLTIPQAAISNTAGTFECWIKLLRSPGTNQQYILDLNGATNYGLKFYIRTDGKLECVFGTGAAETTITGTNALVANTLYHVAVTWGAAGVTIYRNGPSEGTSGTAPGIVAGALVYLGSKADGTLQLDGFMDDLRIEDSARSGTEIAADYASATALPLTSHTLGKWAFDSALTGSGSILTCDRRLETCTLYTNQLRFGGWPSMPQIGQKWSYTVTSPQPLSDRSGTIAPRPAPVQAPPVVSPSRVRPKVLPVIRGNES
jgi:hypothetical protein